MVSELTRCLLGFTDVMLPCAGPDHVCDGCVGLIEDGLVKIGGDDEAGEGVDEFLTIEGGEDSIGAGRGSGVEGA